LGLRAPLYSTTSVPRGPFHDAVLKRRCDITEKKLEKNTATKIELFSLFLITEQKKVPLLPTNLNTGTEHRK
jgi:hypothetical protein